MQNIQNIELSRLSAWEGNVRRAGADEAIEGLAANIAAHGLLQPLVVQDAGDGAFSVVAGRRRFLALQELVKTGRLSGDSLIACTVKKELSDATEVSLSENVMQLPMHPADKFEAFRQLADKGMAAADIAVRFGVPETAVIRLLKLGRVSPEVMRAYRGEQIDYGQIQAFAISDDHAAQNQVLEMLLAQDYRMSPQQVRSQLVKDEVPATDKRVRFVGLEFYEHCGGPVRRDLFDDENSGYVQDAGLLNELVNGQLQAAADELKGESWKWVEIIPDCDWNYLSRFGHVYPEARELSAEDAEKLENLTQEYGQLHEQGFYEDDEENPEAAARMRELQQQMEALEDAGREWAMEDKAIAGIAVSLHHDGNLRIERGLVKPEDAGQLRKHGGEAGGAAREGKAKPEFSSALMRDLTSYRTAALRIELARQPDVALAAVAHALAVRVFYNCGGGSCVKISGTPRTLFRDAEEAIPSVKALDDEKSSLHVPEDVSGLWSWCLERSRDELLKLLAVCAASSVDAVNANDYRASDSGLEHADSLAFALKLDMRKWFVATADNLFGRISRKQILQAYTEVTGESPSNGLLDLKKGDLAARAGREIGDKWLPSVLRPPVAGEEPWAEAA
jgi:ParB family chromosome partitioning protein